MSFFTFLDYLEPSMAAAVKAKLKEYYDLNRETFVDVNDRLGKVQTYRFVNHGISIVVGFSAEQLSRRTDFSFVRAMMYYFATYSFTSSFIFDEITGATATQLNDFLDRTDKMFADFEKEKNNF